MPVDVYNLVTQRIIKQLEKGVVPWRKTWSGVAPMNYVSRKTYRGVNLLLLPFGGEFLTFKQCIDCGGHIKKGEKGHMIVFFKMFEKTNEDIDEVKVIPLLRYSTVFHLNQCEGLESKLQFTQTDTNSIDSAQSIIDNYRRFSLVQVKHVTGSIKPCYVPSIDEVIMPEQKQFESNIEYYSTMFHELAHSTGHRTRLNRLKPTSQFGDEEYSKEELIAEITSANLMNIAGIEIAETFENSVSYVSSWIKVLDGDKKFIVIAATQAQKATDLILGIQDDLNEKYVCT